MSADNGPPNFIVNSTSHGPPGQDPPPVDFSLLPSDFFSADDKERTATRAVQILASVLQQNPNSSNNRPSTETFPPLLRALEGIATILDISLYKLSEYTNSNNMNVLDPSSESEYAIHSLTNSTGVAISSIRTLKGVIERTCESSEEYSNITIRNHLEELTNSVRAIDQKVEKISKAPSSNQIVIDPNSYAARAASGTDKTLANTSFPLRQNKSLAAIKAAKDLGNRPVVIVSTSPDFTSEIPPPFPPENIAPDQVGSWRSRRRDCMTNLARKTVRLILNLNPDSHIIDSASITGKGNIKLILQKDSSAESIINLPEGWNILDSSNWVSVVIRDVPTEHVIGDNGEVLADSFAREIRRKNPLLTLRRNPIIITRDFSRDYQSFILSFNNKDKTQLNNDRLITFYETGSRWEHLKNRSSHGRMTWTQQHTDFPSTPAQPSTPFTILNGLPSQQPSQTETPREREMPHTPHSSQPFTPLRSSNQYAALFSGHNEY